jgi:hypothetical protein
MGNDHGTAGMVVRQPALAFCFSGRLVIWYWRWRFQTPIGKITDGFGELSA